MREVIPSAAILVVLFIVWLWALPSNHGLWFCRPCNRMNTRGAPCTCGRRQRGG